MQQSAYDDDIIERVRIVECAPRLQLDTAARTNRRERVRDDGPRAPHRLAPIAVVATESQYIYEAGKRSESEVRQKDDPELHLLASAVHGGAQTGVEPASACTRSTDVAPRINGCRRASTK